MMRVRVFLWLLAAAVCAVAASATAAEETSLRSALRALQRRRRAPIPDSYLADYSPIMSDKNEHISNKERFMNYINKDEDYPTEALENNYYTNRNTPFRERNKQLKSHHYKRMGNKPKELKQIILNELRQEEAEREQEEEEEEELIRAQDRSDAEYAELLEALWEKYKYNHPESYQDEQTRKYKVIKKRQIPGDYTPSGWGPVAFKRKRSSKQRIDIPDIPNDFLYSLKFVSQNDPSVLENLKDDKMVDEEDDADVSKVIYREPDPRFPAFDLPTPKSALIDNNDDYLLSLQPDANPESAEQMYQQDSDLIYDGLKEKRFPVSKRSSIQINNKLKRSNKNKMYRSAGTDPRVMKELSSIFGSSDANTLDKVLSSQPVKRSSTSSEESSHEAKPPTITVLSHHHDNHTSHHHDDHNNTEHNHQHHEHESKPPLLSSSDDSDHSHENKESKVDFGDEEETHIKLEHPIILKKKSIDWSNYFGLDKRKKKSVKIDDNMLRNEYLNRAQQYINEYRDKKIEQSRSPALKELFSSDNKNAQEDKRDPKQVEQIKLDSMDNKLKNMETTIVNEALQYSGSDEGLDTKEEQQVKEKILSRLATAYSLAKMRKALKEFKMSLQMQRDAMKNQPMIELENDKEKRLSVKHQIKDNDAVITSKQLDADDSELGAENYLSTAANEQMSEGFMGGQGLSNKGHHGRALFPRDMFGSCPILDGMIRRCGVIDYQTDNNQHQLLPLCVLHQICYLCGPSSPSPCDDITDLQQMALPEPESYYHNTVLACDRNSCLGEAMQHLQLWVNKK